MVRWIDEGCCKRVSTSYCRVTDVPGSDTMAYVAPMRLITAGKFEIQRIPPSCGSYVAVLKLTLTGS